MKLMHSLPQQISITHTNGPHLRPRCKKGKQHTRKSSINKKKKLGNEMAGTLDWRLYDEHCLLKVLMAKAS